MLEILLHIFIDDVPSLHPAQAKQHAFELRILIYNVGLLLSEKKNPKHPHFLCKAGLLHLFPLLTRC